MTEHKSAGITGLGTCLPDKVVTNFDLEKLVDTSDEWIFTRTGIRERRVVSESETVSHLAAGAGRSALARAGIRPQDVELILVATGSPEMIWPSTACLVQGKLGCRAAAFDLQAACSGFSYGLSVAAGYIGGGAYKTILLIGAEAITRHVNWQDRGTCVLFGDAAAAAVIGPVEDGYGILASYLGADGSRADWLKIPAGGSALPRAEDWAKHAITMNGNEVFKFAVREVPESTLKVLRMAGLGVEDIDFFIPHQANQRIIEAVAERIGLSKDRVVSNIAQFGNTSCASIPLALAELREAGKLRRGSVVVLAAFGAGLTWGANVIRWW